MRILLLIFGITLLGCSWTSKSEKELIVSKNYSLSNVELIKTKSDKQKNDSILKFDLLEIEKKALYTGGGKTKKDDTKTNGIFIKKIANNQIEYTYSQLINWKREFNKKGIAELISVSDSIMTIKELKEASYKFVDYENDIIIFITKNKKINITKSKVFNKTGKQISELMYNK